MDELIKSATGRTTAALLSAVAAVAAVGAVGFAVVRGVQASTAAAHSHAPTHVEPPSSDPAPTTAAVARVRIVLPEVAAGYHRVHSAAARKLEKQLTSPPERGFQYAAAYGVGDDVVASISVAQHPTTDASRRHYLTSTEAALLAAADLGVKQFRDVDPGQLGGVMRCAAAGGGAVTMCLFADGDALGSINVFAPIDSEGLRTAVALREAVERRS